MTPVSNAVRAFSPCKSRSFSVLGDETFTVAKSIKLPQVSKTFTKSIARCELFLFAPKFNPTIPVLGRFDNRSAITSIPSLLNPNLLIDPWSSFNLKRRGLLFPFCGSGVAAPTSINPKPVFNKGAITSAFLSNPAAKPIGFGSSRPAIFCFKRLLV